MSFVRPISLCYPLKGCRTDGRRRSRLSPLPNHRLTGGASLIEGHFMKHETSPILQPVYSVNGCAGHILRTARGYRACDANDKPIGTYETAASAATAVLDRASSTDTA
jgi:hypothetical protein